MKAIVWLPFFASPFFWSGALSSHVGMDMLALATALLASALLTKNDNNHSSWHWFFFLLLIAPIFLHYFSHTLRAPWQEFRLCIYLASAWLIYRMSQSFASRLIESAGWATLLAVVGNFYVLFAICGMYGVHPFSGNLLFPIWAPNQNNFGGPLIQRNMESLFMCLIVVLLLYQSTKGKGKAATWLLASILPFASIFLSSSRAAPFVLVAGICLSLWVIKEKRTYLTQATLCLLGAVALSAYLHIPGELIITDRLASEASGINPRLFIWSLSSVLVLENPWLGIGWGNLIAHGTDAQELLFERFPSTVELQTGMNGTHSWTHNYFLEFLVSAGILGGLLALSIVFSLLYKLSLILRNKNGSHASFMAAVGACMILIHGMVSIAIFQGFFLALFALFMAGTFPSPLRRNEDSRIRFAYIFPALIVAGIWGSMISTQRDLEEKLTLPLNSDAFITSMSAALENPWTHEQALRHYAAKIIFANASNHVWIQSEYLINSLWNEFQSSVHLKFLIMKAHIKSDQLSETRLINKFTKTFSIDPACDILIHHRDIGHEKGEPIDVWK